MSEEALKWKARFERERASKKEAESLLEDKSKELYELNQSLQDKVKEEVEKNREKESFLVQQSKLASMGEMLGNIAHQWRQPLSAITSATTAVQMEKQLSILNDESLDKLLNIVMKNANYLSQTIEDFRNFFKTNKEREDFNVKSLIDSVENIVYATYQNHKIELSYEYPKDDVMCNGLESELSQVIVNIFNNAKDVLIDKEIVDKKVKVILTQKEDNISIKICDSAGGVPDELISKIFDPYFTTKHQSQGTGIGLYMSREIVTNHFNGILSVENRDFYVGDERYFGACFEINIPNKFNK